MAEKKKPPGKKPSPKKPATGGKSAGAKKTPHKKSPVKKKPASRQTPPLPSKRWLETAATGVTTLLFVAFALFVGYLILHPKSGDKPAPPVADQLAYKDKPIKQASPVKKPAKEAPVKEPPLKTTKFTKPDYEIYPEKPVPSRRDVLKFEPSPPSSAETAPKPPKAVTPPVEPSQPQNDTHLPRVAIIIDDFGYDLEIANRFMEMGGVLTCSVLPHSPHGRQIAILAKRKGHEVMLHQPMEPNEYPAVDPGPGALLAGMSPDERIRRLNANIDLIPGLSGVNNHMGSKLTTLSDEMNQVFTVLKQRGLFFVDSRTTAASITQSSARLFKVPYAERDVFLDHVRTASEVRAQLEHLVAIAEVHGRAIGIGHPYEVTYQVLKSAMPWLQSRVRLSPASELVEVF